MISMELSDYPFNKFIPIYQAGLMRSTSLLDAHKKHNPGASPVVIQSILHNFTDNEPTPYTDRACQFFKVHRGEFYYFYLDNAACLVYWTGFYRHQLA